MDNCLTDCTQLSEKLVLFALMLLMLHYFPIRLVCNFVRRLVYILQTIRISLILAGILPFVLHQQLKYAHPKLDYKSNPHLIVLSLITNIAIAMTIRYVIRRRQVYK